MTAPAFKKKSPVKSEKGFTLLEIVIALVIMMVVGLAAVGGFAFAIRYNSATADRAASISIAQSAVEKFRALAFTDSGLTAGTTTTTVSDVLVSGKTTLKTISVTVTPVNSSGPLNTSSNGYYGSVKLFTERCN